MIPTIRFHDRYELTRSREPDCRSLSFDRWIYSDHMRIARIDFEFKPECETSGARVISGACTAKTLPACFLVLQLMAMMASQGNRSNACVLQGSGDYISAEFALLAHRDHMEILLSAEAERRGRAASSRNARSDQRRTRQRTG